MPMAGMFSSVYLARCSRTKSVKTAPARLQGMQNSCHSVENVREKPRSGRHDLRHLRAAQEALICLAQLGIAQQEESGVLLRQRARLVDQAHADVLEQAIAFTSVAGAAARHQIFPEIGRAHV